MDKRFFFRRSLHDDRDGVAAVEFAYLLPFLLILFLGTMEIIRKEMISLKVQNTAFAMSDLATQGETLSQGELDTIAAAVTQTMRPFTFSGTIIFSHVSYDPDTDAARIDWQRSYPAGGDSGIGAEGGAAALPNNFIIRPGQRFIVSEVFYNYEPLTDGLDFALTFLEPHVMSTTAMYSPRFGDLSVLAP